MFPHRHPYRSSQPRATRRLSAVVFTPRERRFSSAAKYGSDDMYDVIIIGGGMVGSALACALGGSAATSGQRIALLESGPPLQRTRGSVPDLRVSALSTASTKLFQALRVWEDIVPERATPYNAMKVWDGVSNASIAFDSNDTNVPELGWIIENSIFRSAGCAVLLFDARDIVAAALQRRVADYKNVDVLYNTSAKAIDTGSDFAWASVTTSEGRELSTRLIVCLISSLTRCSPHLLTTALEVGADGTTSSVRAAARIGVVGYEYNQRGVVATVELEEPNTTAWQRFLPNGPVALLPLTAPLSSIVWSTTPYQAEVLLRTPDDKFVQELNRALHSELSVLGPLSSLFKRDGDSVPKPPVVRSLRSKRAAFPLRYLHAAEYVRPRVALIGDAAHTAHPLAGQGVNLGYADVAALARTLIDAVETGQDIGNIAVLRQYQQSRLYPLLLCDSLSFLWHDRSSTSNAVVLEALDWIHRLFTSSFFPVVAARGLGLSLAGGIEPLKAALMRVAAGDSVDLSGIGESAPEAVSRGAVPVEH